MPPVEILNRVSERDARSALTDDVRFETLAHEHDADQLGEPTRRTPADAGAPSKEHRAHGGGSTAAAPARSVRRATARRASTRRATARSRQSDTEASIIDFLAQHPESTVGDLAKGLNLKPESVSTRLTQLSKTGEIKKASHGYSTEQAARPATSTHPDRSHRAQSSRTISHTNDDPPK